MTSKARPRAPLTDEQLIARGRRITSPSITFDERVRLDRLVPRKKLRPPGRRRR